jgi:hypothetical protein
LPAGNDVNGNYLSKLSFHFLDRVDIDILLFRDSMQEMGLLFPGKSLEDYFSDRVEIRSPGTLHWGVDKDKFMQGKASPKWRNQSFAYLFNKLQLQRFPLL